MKQEERNIFMPRLSTERKKAVGLSWKKEHFTPLCTVMFPACCCASLTERKPERKLPVSH